MATTTTFEAVRAEALFVSDLQCSQAPRSDEIRTAVATTLRRVGIKGCATQVAGEFGDHPDTAVARMAWALALVRSTYPIRRNAPRSVRLLARSA